MCPCIQEIDVTRNWVVNTRLRDATKVDSERAIPLVDLNIRQISPVGNASTKPPERKSGSNISTGKIVTSEGHTLEA